MGLRRLVAAGVLGAGFAWLAISLLAQGAMKAAFPLVAQVSRIQLRGGPRA